MGKKIRVKMEGSGKATISGKQLRGLIFLMKRANAHKHSSQYLCGSKGQNLDYRIAEKRETGSIKQMGWWETPTK